MSIGANIKRLREASKMSQEELCSRLNDAGRTRALEHMALLVQIYSKDA